MFAQLIFSYVKSPDSKAFVKNEVLGFTPVLALSKRSAFMIRFIYSTLILSLSFTTFAHADVEFREETCIPQRDGEPVVRNSDFSWGLSREDILAKQQEIYSSGKRLQKRAYYDADKKVFKAPVQTFGDSRKEMVLPERILKSVRAHIEKSLKREYVDAIIFPDMGHSHYFIPQEFYDREIAPIPSSQKALKYEKILAHEGLKILYHTAEQLKMVKEVDGKKKLIEDRVTQWRFYTRNLIGDNKMQGHMEFVHNEEHSHNTARSYEEGHKYWGGGFYISASEKGCFVYKHKGETYYFDMNFSGLAQASGGGDWGL